MKKILSLLVAVMAMAGCSCIGGECVTADYSGTYEGNLVSANGTEIENFLFLNDDGTYSRQQYYAGMPDGIFTEQGRYSVNGNRLTLRPNNGMMSAYQIEKCKLLLLQTSEPLRSGTYVLNKI